MNLEELVAWIESAKGLHSIAFALGSILLVYLSFTTIRSVYRLMRLALFDTFIAPWSKPLSVKDRPGGKRLLILGDSTAVGTGAHRPEETIAGRLAHDFPQAEIINLGANGARTRDALKAIASMEGEHFDMLVLSVGGNDVWHFTSLKKLKRDLRDLLEKAKKISSGRVVVLVYNNIGAAPIFPNFMRSLLFARGVKVHEIFHEVGKETGSLCVDLFATKEDNPFLHDPHMLFAPDGVHPSGEGYRLWYNRMWRLLVSNGYTF